MCAVVWSGVLPGVVAGSSGTRFGWLMGSHWYDLGCVYGSSLFEGRGPGGPGRVMSRCRMSARLGAYARYLAAQKTLFWQVLPCIGDECESKTRCHRLCAVGWSGVLPGVVAESIGTRCGWLVGSHWYDRGCVYGSLLFEGRGPGGPSRVMSRCRMSARLGAYARYLAAQKNSFWQVLPCIGDECESKTRCHRLCAVVWPGVLPGVVAESSGTRCGWLGEPLV